MNVPCLFITFDRLNYTRQALQSLLESDIEQIFIWDNNSTDGTAEYLLTVNNPKIKYCCFHHINAGIRIPMNWFIDHTKNYDVVAKVDNDTLIPKDFCARMIPHLAHADVVQAKHHIIEATCKGGWDAFIKPMYKNGGLCFNSFVGGSGIVIKRKMLSDLPATDWLLYSWMTWQKQNPHVTKAFATDCEIKLLDEHGYPKEYEDYYRKTGRIK